MRTMTLSVVLVAMVGCGGGGKGATEPTGGEVDDEPSGGDPVGDGESMVDPVAMDEIQQLLDRKRGAAARCLSEAVNNGDVDRKAARGTVQLAFVVGTDGRASGIKVIDSTIDNEGVISCVKGKVGEIQFPRIAHPLDWSYRFVMDTL
jgi:hypothetical protein